MSYTVALYTDDKLTDNRKYRNGFPANKIWEGTNVNIGNFGNVNLFCDNTVELGCAIIVGGIVTIPAITIAHRATHIMVSDYTTHHIVGAITAWDYVNDNNVKFTYVVDAFMSAQLSNEIVKMEGYCERVNLDNIDFPFANDQPEPFTPSDVCVPDNKVTESFNLSIANFEAIDPSDSGVTTGGTSIIITVSNAIARFLNLNEPFSTPGTVTPSLKTVSNFEFGASDTYVHSGGVFKGFPLKFNSFDAASTFINQILSGCGFRSSLPATGYSTMQSVTNRLLVSSGNDNGAQVWAAHKNWNNDPYEAIRFISGNDIYAMYCIPTVFAEYYENYYTDSFLVNDFPNLNTAFSYHGPEGKFASKLLAYPYIYYKLVTANGDSINIIPQVHYVKSVGVDSAFIVRCNLRFIGGDTPRLMMRILGAYQDGDIDQNPYTNSACCEWFTVRSYPAVTLSFNATTSQQAERDITSFKKLAQGYINSWRQTRIEAPFKSGYMDTVANGNSSHNDQNMGALNQLSYSLGSGLGYLQRGAQWTGLYNGVSLYSNSLGQSARAQYNENQAGNFIVPESGSVMGNDFTSQFGQPAVAAYWCGATDAELFTFARYLEEFGTACNCIINPITNSGNILGGHCIINQFNGQTYYQFSYIEIEGAMPIAWKQNIKALFESGVYLIG